MERWKERTSYTKSPSDLHRSHEKPWCGCSCPRTQHQRSRDRQIQELTGQASTKRVKDTSQGNKTRISRGRHYATFWYTHTYLNLKKKKKEQFKSLPNWTGKMTQQIKALSVKALGLEFKSPVLKQNLGIVVYACNPSVDTETGRSWELCNQSASFNQQVSHVIRHPVSTNKVKNDTGRYETSSSGLYICTHVHVCPHTHVYTHRNILELYQETFNTSRLINQLPVKEL